MRTGAKCAALAAAVTASTLITVPVPAQVLEELVVTAQKREQALSDVGISITAFSGEQLKELGYSNTMQIDDQVPGLMVVDYGSRTTTVFNIRGSQQLDVADHQEPPVAVYIDGAYYSYLAGVGFNFFDLERIEVLRGPQGTLFGRNATGGLVHIISAKPTRELEGYVELEGGEYDHYRAEGAISGPLTESLSGRLSLYREKNDGYIENRGPLADSGQLDNISGRAQLMFEPSDALSVLLSMRYSDDDISTGQIWDAQAAVADIGGIPGLPGDGYVHADPTDPQLFAFCTALEGINFIPTAPAPGGNNCFGTTETADPYSVVSNTQGFFERTHVDGTLTVTYEMANGELTSITDWQDFEKNYLEDSDGSVLQLLDFFQDVDGNQFSQEIRFAAETERTHWLIGAYYLNIDGTFRAGIDAEGSGDPTSTDFLGSLGFSIDNRYETETTSYAFFGQLEWNFTPTLTGNVGFRWTDDEKDIEINSLCSANPALGLPPGLTNLNCQILFSPLGLVQGPGLPKTTRSEDDWSGHVQLDWRPNDDWLVYGKVSRGHKGGGFNAGSALFFLPNEVEYDSERAISYELGFKSQLFGDKAAINASAFYIDYNDFQTFTQRGALSLLLFNIDAEVLGAELELFTNPWDGWQFTFGLSLLDADQKDLDGPGGVLDRPMPGAPDLTFNALGRYEWPMFKGVGGVQLDMVYVDERTLNGIDHPALTDGDYVVANASVSWTSEDDHWQLKLWVKNFTDEVYVPYAFETATVMGSLINAQPPPRWFGGTVTFRL